MTEKNRWQIVLAGLTVTLLACEDTITSFPEPEVEALAEAVLEEAAAVAGTDLITWWPGEADFKDIAEPLADAHDITTVQGVTTTPAGVDGSAFLFTGQDGQFLEIQDQGSDLHPAEFTVDLWVQRLGEGENPNTAPLIQKAYVDNAFSNPGLSWFITWTDDANGSRVIADVAFARTPPITGAPSPRLASGALADETWNHVALTVDGNRNTTLYVNGASQGTFQGAAGTSPVYSNGSIIIGNSPMWVRAIPLFFTFNGCIDEVRILNRALDAAEVTEIYGDGVDGSCLPPEEEPEPENTAPVVDLTAVDGGTVDEGSLFASSLGSFTDPDEGDSWTATVDYGDGNGDEFQALLADKAFDLSHVYADDGSYTVTVTVKDAAGAVGSASTTVVVNNVAPSVTDGPEDDEIMEGDIYTSYVSFDDPGADEWTAVVDWGDGSEETLDMVGPMFELSHVYAANEACGPFTVTVTVTDDDGGASDGTAQAEVTVVHQVSVYRAHLRLDRRRRQARDQFDVGGRLPRSLVGCLGPGDVVTVEVAGTVLGEVPFDDLAHRDRWWDKKWHLTGRRPSSGIRQLDLYDHGLFSVQVRSSDLRGLDLSGPVTFSISIGPDSGKTEVQLDRRGHLWKGWQFLWRWKRR